MDQAYTKFWLAIETLTNASSNKHTCHVCLTCDRLLQWKDCDILPVSPLKKLRNLFQGEGSFFTEQHRKTKSDYTNNGPGHETWINDMYLSPRGIFVRNQNGFQCCNVCYKALCTSVKPSSVKLPRFLLWRSAYVDAWMAQSVWKWFRWNCAYS